MIKKVLIMGMAVLMLLTGCYHREEATVEKDTEQSRVTEFISYESFDVNVGCPAELSDFVQQYADEYVFPEEVVKDIPEGLLDEMIVRCEIIEADDVIVEMPKDYDTFYDLYFFYEDQLSELEELGGVRFYLETIYVAENG